ncbi:MAG: hypothetical protein BKP49_04030 [Treponema sp. CETP13]|nr:MAG: hypothetical protein BKP49_04030 [Treponema sp. CETP13]
MKIDISHIVKKFPQKKVLDDISYTFQTGKFYALLGENGAGKSTLSNILSGFIRPSSGTIFINGNRVLFEKPADSQKFQIQTVQQRPLLANELTVKENIMLGHEKEEFHQDFLIYPIPLHKKVSKLTASERFFTAFAACLITHPQFIILDEPASSLDIKQRNKLYSYLHKLLLSNIGILIISHDRLEALRIAEIVIELQNGKIHEVTHFIEYPETDSVHLSANTNSDIDKNEAFRVEHLTARPIDRPALFDSSFIVKTGMVTAITGQRESGLETLEDIITGISSKEIDTGSFFLFGTKIKHISPRLLRDNGTAIIPFDRNFRGSHPTLTIEEMLTVHYKGSIKRQKEYAKSIVAKAGISIHLDDKVSYLSGGMLQRLIAFRELETHPRLFILCNPTRGMDTKSAKEFTLLIQNVANSGTAVLVLTNSNSILSHIASNTYILNSGHIVHKTEKLI